MKGFKSYEIWQSVFRAGFVFCALLVLVLALMPNERVSVTTGWDKSNHLLAFFVLNLLLDLGFVRWRWWPHQVLLLLGYGVLIELLQLLTPDRSSSIADLVADMIGLAVYGCFIRFAVASWRCKFRSLLDA